MTDAHQVPSDEVSSSHDPADEGAGQVSPLGEGARWEGDDPEMLAAAVEAAFDYRGDVTVLLEDGEEAQGYLCNRVSAGEDPYLHLLAADASVPRTIPYRSVRGLVFSGKDTASGKSWETWLKKYEAKKKARERGEDTGPLGLFPEPLE